MLPVGLVGGHSRKPLPVRGLLDTAQPSILRQIYGTKMLANFSAGIVHKPIDFQLATNLFTSKNTAYEIPKIFMIFRIPIRRKIASRFPIRRGTILCRCRDVRTIWERYHLFWSIYEHEG